MNETVENALKAGRFIIDYTPTAPTPSRKSWDAAAAEIKLDHERDHHASQAISNAARQEARARGEESQRHEGSAGSPAVPPRVAPASSQAYGLHGASGTRTRGDQS